MLESLKILNFQKHTSLTVQFDPLVTVLTGKTDSGKSAVLRALRWIFQNKPSGDAFVRKGADLAKAVLRVDGHTVARVKGKGKNEYRLDSKVYRSFGTSGVPDDVAKLLNADEESFQGQHSPAFWLSDTPGQVSRSLNRIVALDLIDRTLGNLASALRTAKAAVEVSEDRLRDARHHRDALRWARDADGALRGLEGKQQALDALRPRREALAGLLGALGRAERAAGAVLPERELAALELQWGRLREVRMKRATLEGLLRQLDRAEGEAERAGREALEAEQELKEGMGNTCKLCGQSLK